MCLGVPEKSIRATLVSHQRVSTSNKLPLADVDMPHRMNPPYDMRLPHHMRIHHHMRLLYHMKLPHLMTLPYYMVILNDQDKVVSLKTFFCLALIILITFFMDNYVVYFGNKL